MIPILDDDANGMGILVFMQIETSDISGDREGGDCKVLQVCDGGKVSGLREFPVHGLQRGFSVNWRDIMLAGLPRPMLMH